MAKLQSNAATFEIDGTTVELTLEDVLYETAQTPGFAAASDKGVTVVIDTTLTPELIEEGYVREIISKIQTMRKDAGFEVTDKIKIYYIASQTLTAVLEKNAAFIASETLAEGVTGGTGGYTKEWDINGEAATLGVEKI